MSRTASSAIQGGFTYFGSNNYTYAGNQNYTYAGPTNYAQAIEPYGFDGFPGNPMLSAGITATREALLRSLRPGSLGGTGDLGELRTTWYGENEAESGLPRQEQAAHVRRYAGTVRASLAQLELMSSIEFKFQDDGFATLSAALKEGGGKTHPIVKIKRPNRDYFVAQLELVNSLSTRRDSRDREILTQVAPPFAYFASVLNLQAGRHRRTMEVVNIALQFAYAVCQRFKHTLACPRPSEYSTTVQPMIEVPMHLTFPAGHATEGHLTAAILGALAGVAETSTSDIYLRRLAHRIGENRVVAGLHFPVDIIAGQLLGDALSSYFLTLCSEDPSKTCQGAKFDGGALPDNAQPEEPSLNKDLRFTDLGCKTLDTIEGGKLALRPLIQEMWKEAKEEWN